MVHQLVIGCPEDRVAGVLAPTGLIDQGLGMLDAKADREGLGLHRHALAMQQGKGVARAVAHGKHSRIGFNALACGQGQRLELACAR